VIRLLPVDLMFCIEVLLDKWAKIHQTCLANEMGLLLYTMMSRNHDETRLLVDVLKR